MAKPGAAGGKRWRKSKGGGNLGGRGSRCFGFLVFLAGVSVGFGVPRVFMFRTSKTDTIDPHSARSSFTNTKTSSPPPPRSLLPPPGKNFATSGKLISKEGEKNGLERAKTAETSRKFENSEKRNAENPGNFETGKEKKALIFTMDSLSSRVDESKKGGASGEMTIRICLQKGLQRLGFDVTVARSDAEFEGVKDFGQFRLIFLDPWTWAGKGWILKPFLNGHVDKIYLLDFFGSDGHKNLNHLVPLSRHLTAYPVGNSNTFLGYFIEQDDPKNKIKNPSKKPQGVIWGKDPKYYKNKHQMLETIASASKLVSTAPASALPRHPNITSIGHISPQQWNSLLLESRLGLGERLQLGIGVSNTILSQVRVRVRFRVYAFSCWVRALWLGL
ncbi:hypothetical protein AAMO2058_001330400 [Amorphochlora amoebiformis]